MLQPESGKTILIVEDQPLVLQLIIMSLEKFNFTILTSSDGTEALDTFKKNLAIDLVISDINMPKMNGTALARALKIIKPSVKVILMTGLPMNNRADEMKALGISAFLMKPFKPDVLISAIENAFDPAS